MSAYKAQEWHFWILNQLCFGGLRHFPTVLYPGCYHFAFLQIGQESLLLSKPSCHMQFLDLDDGNCDLLGVIPPPSLNMQFYTSDPRGASFLFLLNTNSKTKALCVNLTSRDCFGRMATWKTFSIIQPKKILLSVSLSFIGLCLPGLCLSYFIRVVSVCVEQASHGIGISWGTQTLGFEGFPSFHSGSVVATAWLQSIDFSTCGTTAQELLPTRHLSPPGVEHLSSAQQVEFLSTGLPERPARYFLKASGP